MSSVQYQKPWIHGSSSSSSLEMSSSSSSSRPGMLRRDTEGILDYYQSPDADRDYIAPSGEDTVRVANYNTTRPLSIASSRSATVAGSTTPSTMHSRSSSMRQPPDRPGSSASSSMSSRQELIREIQRRPSVRSVGGADKRRLAIVELDSPSGSSSAASSTHALPLDTSEPPASAPPDATQDASSAGNLFARRGINRSRLALVGPPDASPQTYADLTYAPPASAPAYSAKPKNLANEPESRASPTGHQRSASEATTKKAGSTTPKTVSSSRDIGIVGIFKALTSSTTDISRSSSKRGKLPELHESVDTTPTRRSESANSHGKPMFQTPRLGTPSPYDTPQGSPLNSPRLDLTDAELSARGWTVSTPLTTPAIGQEKDPMEKVAGPVVVGIGNEEIWKAGSGGTRAGKPVETVPQDSLQHDAMKHATAQTVTARSLMHNNSVRSVAGGRVSAPVTRPGTTTPLSSPPPPRPPRLHSPPPTRRNGDGTSMAALHSQPNLPLSMTRQNSDYSIAAVSLSSADDRILGSTPSSSHVREGAFPPSSIFLTHPPRGQPKSPSPPSTSTPPTPSEIIEDLVAQVGEAIDNMGFNNSEDGAPPAVGDPPRDGKSSRRDKSINRDGNALDLRNSPPNREAGNNYVPTDYTSRSPTRTPSAGDLSSSPAETRNSSPLSHRRSVIPRATSLRAMSRASFTHDRKGQHLGALFIPKRTLKPQKPRNLHPDAMTFTDVLGLPTALARATGYAEKINALATEDCGLRDWIAFVKTRSVQTGMRPGTPHARTFGEQRRHVSNNSVGTEVTFPTRPDAYTATDLSHKPGDSPPHGLPPSLPYPSLAQGIGVRHSPSHRMFGTPSPAGSSRGLVPTSTSTKTGFFATIGRKASMRARGDKEKDRVAALVSPERQPTKFVNNNRAPQRPIHLVSPPTIPGGPRAPPSRHRSGSVIVIGNNRHSVESSESEAVATRPNSLIRTPSFPGQSLASQGSPSQRTSLSLRPSPSLSGGTFLRNLEKLIDVLPHVDRDILTGYLRRAGGKDLIAIGAYLEDEKNGTVIQPSY